MSQPALQLPADLRATVADFFEARAAAVDAGQATVREGLEFAARTNLAGPDSADSAPPSLLREAQAIAALAEHDVSTAFGLWCQRMVVEYLRHAPEGSPLRTQIRPRLLRAELLGSTALAAALAYHCAGTPLPVTWRRDGTDHVLDGRISWASNLCPHGFVQVTAAGGADGMEPVVVALTPDMPGFHPASFPILLGLQATQSASVTYKSLRVPEEWVITRRLGEFMDQIRPRFLVLQSSFCWGLAHRALSEGAKILSGANEIFQGDLAELDAWAARLGATLARLASDPASGGRLRDFVKSRLDCAQLAAAAVALEVKLAGGRAYTQHHPTNRRLREAAFLPIQAPTEGQLRWELKRLDGL